MSNVLVTTHTTTTEISLTWHLQTRETQLTELHM